MSEFSIPPRANLKWLAVDLDGTLAEPLWTPENPTSSIGEPISENLAKVWHAFDHGYKIVIHTSRPWTDYEAIEAWLDFYEIPFRGIVCGKILAHSYIDDRAVHASEKTWIPT